MTVRKSTACNMYNINIIKLFMSLLFHWSVVVCIVYIYICYLDKKKDLSLSLFVFNFCSVSFILEKKIDEWQTSYGKLVIYCINLCCVCFVVFFCNLFVSNFCFYFKYCITFGELIVNLVEVCFNVFAMNDANSNDLIF